MILSGNLDLPGVIFLVSAEQIQVTALANVDTTGGATDGSITLGAADSQTGTPVLGVVAPTATAAVSVTDAVLRSGAITLSATSLVNPASPTGKYLGLYANSTATVAVTDSQVETTGTGDATILAESTVTAALNAAGQASQTSTSFDAAISGSIVNSTATSSVIGTSSVLAGGALSIKAKNTVTSANSGDASSASGGAGVAFANVTQVTRAYIDGLVAVTAASSTIAADADGSSTVTSKASPNGSSGNDDNDATTTDDSPTGRTAGNASTSQGSVAVAGSLSFSRLQSTTEAYVDGNPNITTSGAQKVHAGSKARSSARADGSSVDASGTALGVAVAVNLATITTSAHIGDAELNGPSVVVEATIPETATFAAESISGVGDATNLTVAGSLAIGVITMSTVAGVDAASTIDAAGIDVRFAATSALDSTVSATPAAAAADDTTGGNVGIGASIAVHVVTQTTDASVGDGASVAADDLTLESTSSHNVDTSAVGGAAGGTAITPVVSVTISNVTTTATVGETVVLTLTGNFAARAVDLSSAVTTAADGDATGTNAAIGASVAVGLSEHVVTATTGSGFLTVGTIEFRASGNSSTETNATASANGAGGAGSSSTPDEQLDSQRTLGNTVATTNGATGSGTNSSTPPASSSSGSITAAAAVSVNILRSTSSASLPSGVTVGSGGLTVWSSALSDAKANADGSATAARGPPATIGAAVAINRADVTNSATVAGTANGPVTVQALVTSSGDSQSDFGATATSGSGGGTVSVAGSLALNIVNLHTSATISGTVNAGAGDVSVAAASSSDSSADARAAQAPADGTAGTSLGIGASVALALVDDTTTASLTGTVNGGDDVSLTATTVNGAIAHAKTGAAGGNVTIVPSVAITLSNVTTSALVSAGSGLSIAGAFSATADQSASAGSSAEGDADGSSAAVGLALGLTIANHTSEAALARNLGAGGAVTLSAEGSSDSSASAAASASGAPQDPTSGGNAGSGVDDKVADERSFADATAASNGGSSSGTSQTPSASTSSGGVSVAAAVAILSLIHI